MCDDIIISILSFVPTEAILRMETVCHDWAQLICDPVFIRAHCSVSCPRPITSFLTRRSSDCSPECYFKPLLSSSPKDPSIITLLISSGFKAVSTSHGLVCFRRKIGGVIILANPATSRWALVPTSVPSSPTDYETYTYTSPVIVYDPALSFHFKLAVAVYNDPEAYCLGFTFTPPRHLHGLYHLFFRMKILSVALLLFGYEIASDTYWKVPLPSSVKHFSEQCYLLDRDGEVYFVIFYFRFRNICLYIGNKKAIVWRLDEKKNWVLEGEASTKEFEKLGDIYCLAHVSYDAARKALIIASKCEVFLYAFYLSSCTIEVLGEEYCSLALEKLPHANTLASFHGGKRDIGAFEELINDDSSPDVET